MNSTTTHTDPGEQTTEETVYLALFRVAAIADLEGPAKAVEWAQSVLDDDRLRAAFIAGVSRAASRRTRNRESWRTPACRWSASAAHAARLNETGTRRGPRR